MTLMPFDMAHSWLGLHKESGGEWKYVDGTSTIKYAYPTKDDREECISVSLKN